MDVFFYALPLPEALSLRVTGMRTELFRRTGEPSLRVLPPLVIFREKGEEDPPLFPCPAEPAHFLPPVIRDGHLMIPVSGLDAISSCLSMEENPALYIGDLPLTDLPSLPPIDDFRMALIHLQRGDGMVIWRTLWEKHLWKGKGKR